MFNKFWASAFLGLAGTGLTIWAETGDWRAAIPVILTGAAQAAGTWAVPNKQ